MKKITILMSIMLITVVVFGQSLMEKRTQHFIQTKGDVEQTRELTIIWEDDFSNSAVWLADYDDGNANDGPWVVGTNGPAGYYSEGMGPIESTTAENGFAMYDSDAIGVEAGSQDSKLIYDGTIDCSAYDAVAVSFQSYYRAFHGNCYIEVSTDGTTWEQFQVHGDIEVNSASANPELITVNISTIAANQANLQFRFRYIGEWDYAWMVDDLKFFVAPDHDLKLADARVNFFQYPHYVDPVEYTLSEYYGYSGFYGMIPQRQITSPDAFMVFDGVVKNIGSIDATPSFSITVTNPTSDEVFTNSAVYGGSLTTEANDTISIIDPELNLADAVQGIYTWTFETFEDGVTEENPADNTIVYETEVTENLYSRDRGTVTGGWSTENYTDGGQDGDLVGVVYPFFNQDTITKGKVYISSMTEVGTSFVFKLMMWDEVASAWVETISSNIVTIADSSDIGVMHEITLPDPFTVEPVDGFVEVLAAVEYYPAGNSFRFGIDGTVPTSGFETWMYFMNDDSWYYYGGDHVPLIQLELTEPLSIAQNSFTDFQVYPNPTSGMLKIENVKDATIEIFNMLGERIALVNNADFVANINLSNYAEGTYIVRVTAEQGVGTRKVNLMK
ncbi:MAG: T9SS type A sorting domain-containing protein [Bacteroidota bacterium]|nr:T9SS type A sorting domain-containing protein [Bacteroidota bacterium]